jgi:hypothetical protein
MNVCSAAGRVCGRQAYLVSFLTLFLIVSGCNAPDESLAPRTTVAVDAVLSRAQALGNEIPIPGCAIAREASPGLSRVVVLPWTALQAAFPLPSLTTGKGSHALHVVRAVHRLAGGGSVAVACAVPYGKNFSAAVDKLAHDGDADWPIVEELLARVGTSVPGTARNLARSRLLARATRSQLPSAISTMATSSVSASEPVVRRGTLLEGGPLLGFGDWTSTWLGTESPVPIGGVTIYATPDNWIFDTLDWYDKLALISSLNTSNPSVFWQVYDYEHCASASELYIAANAEANAYEEHADLLDLLEAPLVNKTCKPVGSGRDICIDFFIRQSRLMGIGYGDDRDFDPEAGWSQSRVQLYLNPNNLEWEVKYTSTKLGWNGNVYVDEDSSAASFNEYSDVVPSWEGSEIKITTHFRNNFCPSLCPAIDAEIRLIPDTGAPGGYRVEWKRDGFPAMGIYRRNSSNTAWQIMIEDPEITKKGDEFRALMGFIRSVSPPQGCMLQ